MARALLYPLRTPNVPGCPNQHPPVGKPSQSTPICLAMMLGVGICAGAGLLPQFSTEAYAQTVSGSFSDGTTRNYHIPAGALGTSLATFASESGLLLSFDPALTNGLNASALSGSYTVRGGLEQLLADSGLKVVMRNGNTDALIVRTTAEHKAAPPEINVGNTSSLPEVTVVGTSLETDIQIYPGSVSVLSQDDLDRSSNVIEAMASVPGVTTGGDSGRTTGQLFNIRGFGYQTEDRVIVLQDGVRRSTALYSNHISTFRSDNDLLKRVEIVKGASSVQHGGGAIGGVVAMTNKDAHDFLPQGKDVGVATKLRYEHNNYREGYLATALAPKDKPYELLIYGKKGKTGDLKMSRVFGTNAQNEALEKVDNDEDLRVLYLQGGLKLTPEQHLSLSYYDYLLDNETTWQTLYHANYSTVTGPVLGQIRQKDTVAKYRYASASNRLLNLQVSAYHSKAGYDRGYSYINANNGDPTDLQYENTDRREGLRVSNEAHFATGSVGHRLVTGLDYEKRHEDAVYLLNGSYTDFGSLPNTYKDVGIYAHLESSMLNDRLVVQLSGRYDRFDRQVDRNDGGYQGSHFSPRLGASYEMFNGFNLLANWSESFRAPTPHETSSEGPLNPHYWYLPNPGLDPETIRETELGFSHTGRNLFTASDTLRTKLMYFNGRISDMIVLKETRNQEVSPQGSPYATYNNIDRVKRHGFEWQMTYDHPHGGAGISYSTLKQTDEATGQITPQAFANKVALNAHWRATQGLKLGVELTHWFKPKQNPQTTVSGGKTYWYVRDDFTITNVFAQWQPNPGTQGILGRDFTVRFGVNNLFDSSYLNARDVETTSRVGKGRNAYLMLQTRF